MKTIKIVCVVFLIGLIINRQCTVDRLNKKILYREKLCEDCRHVLADFNKEFSIMQTNRDKQRLEIIESRAALHYACSLLEKQDVQIEILKSDVNTKSNTIEFLSDRLAKFSGDIIITNRSNLKK